MKTEISSFATVEDEPNSTADATAATAGTADSMVNVVLSMADAAKPVAHGSFAMANAAYSMAHAAQSRAEGEDLPAGSSPPKLYADHSVISLWVANSAAKSGRESGRPKHADGPNIGRAGHAKQAD